MASATLEVKQSTPVSAAGVSTDFQAVDREPGRDPAAAGFFEPDYKAIGLPTPAQYELLKRIYANRTPTRVGSIPTSHPHTADEAALAYLGLVGYWDLSWGKDPDWALWYITTDGERFVEAMEAAGKAGAA